LLDKNPKKILNDVFIKLETEFSDSSPNFILCSKPFIKLEFLKSLIESCNHQVVLLDFDLLYSGYVMADMIDKNNNVKIFRSNKKDFENHIKEIIELISRKKVLVILDSFNSIFNLFDNEDSFRFITASIMLLSSVAKNTKSTILVTVSGMKNENEKWILSPGGKQLIETKNSRMYDLRLRDSKLILNSLNKKQGNDWSFVLSQ